MHPTLHPLNLQKSHLDDLKLVGLTSFRSLRQRRPHKIRSRIQTVKGPDRGDHLRRTSLSEVAEGRDEEDEADGLWPVGVNR
mmetsp:Transcript_27384/g.78934  ORF Transcript_27384/g.78934 Transcript_27384/m.78934 type:complete len:82 (+) Transcript_27384:2437-2682(+)